MGGIDNKVFFSQTGKENYTKGCGVRKAICYAIDREGINHALHGGKLTVAHHPIPDIYDNFRNLNIIKYNRDLDAAFYWLSSDYPTPDYSSIAIESFITVTSIILVVFSLPSYFLIKGNIDMKKEKNKARDNSESADSIKDMN